MRPQGVPLQEFHPHPLSPSFSHPAPRHSLNPHPDHFRDSHRQPPGLPEQTAFLYPSGVSFVTDWPLVRPAPAPKPRPRAGPSPKLWQAKPNPAAARSQCQPVRLRAGLQQLLQPLLPLLPSDWLRVAPGPLLRQVFAPEDAAAIFVTGACP